MTDEEIPPGGTKVSDPRWDPWRPADVTQRLAGVSVPWHAAGGWAIDLFLGRTTRAHGDAAVRLRQALRRLHPGHAWIGALGRDTPDGRPP